ncbi:redox-sensing transcriptional repressor Rex [Candidatus Omnitrophus magneticus]|uniref:Redox-sensing transcriptional repressor Rex n=1 Tax=Candidatus Omnitrophus magneticus TaxID=1609969 RepID=A0A0F0CNB8_9BACT|nr:redox-sensing transcriptional repressor Rex [Candidatus Omnitrophus magneticus]
MCRGGGMKTHRNSVIRLVQYKNILKKFESMGFLKIFSNNLADATGASAAQVRKDFSIFSIEGNKKGGYLVKELILKIEDILGKDKAHKVIVVGAGHIGMALLNYKGFEKEKIKIMAAFDVDPSKYGEVLGIPIFSIDRLPEFVRRHNIKLGISAVPDISAQQTIDIMVSAGIKGILNFAPTQVKGKNETIINNVDVVLELEKVIYYVKTR